MAHIKLKSLIAEIQTPKLKEATLYPPTAMLNSIQTEIEKFLDDREQNKKSFFARFIDVIRHALSDMNGVLPPEVKKKYREISSVRPLNNALEKYRVSFNPYVADTTNGGTTATGLILMNPSSLKTVKKKNGKWDLSDIMKTLGHEFIHREQFRRGLGKGLGTKKQAGGDTDEYFNDQPEVMAWAHTLAKGITDANPSATTEELIHHIKVSKAVGEFLQRYTPNNRKKFVRHMVDYITKLREKTK